MGNRRFRCCCDVPIWGINGIWQTWHTVYYEEYWSPVFSLRNDVPPPVDTWTQAQFYDFDRNPTGVLIEGQNHRTLGLSGAYSTIPLLQSQSLPSGSAAFQFGAFGWAHRILCVALDTAIDPEGTVLPRQDVPARMVYRKARSVLTIGFDVYRPAGASPGSQLWVRLPPGGTINDATSVPETLLRTLPDGALLNLSFRKPENRYDVPINPSLPINNVAYSKTYDPSTIDFKSRWGNDELVPIEGYSESVYTQDYQLENDRYNYDLRWEDLLQSICDKRADVGESRHVTVTAEPTWEPLPVTDEDIQQHTWSGGIFSPLFRQGSVHSLSIYELYQMEGGQNYVPTGDGGIGQEYLVNYELA